MSSTTIQPSLFGWNRLPNTNTRCNDYHVWKKAYFSHLLNMYRIVTDEIPSISTNNNNFGVDFDIFCKVIYEKSSKEISKYIESLTPELEQLYDEIYIG